MKKLIYIVTLLLCGYAGIAQDEEPGEGRLREKMVEYIQTNLSMTRDEAEKFKPVYVEYVKELKRTNKEFRGQGLDFQQKVVDVRVRYRDRFKTILGEKRSNEVFDHERNFLKILRSDLKERRTDRVGGRADKRKQTELLSN